MKDKIFMIDVGIGSICVVIVCIDGVMIGFV